jgi:SAM-dependent methyltransferase
MQWFEDEHLWRELYPYVFSAARMASAAGQVSQIVALTGITQGAVLDLCCGPGRHAVQFATLGFAVTGVDNSDFLLQRARERSGEVEWIHADMREFHRPASFDLACNLFTSFGYFAHEEDNARALRGLFDNLRPGGTLVMDLVGREHIRHQGLEARHTHFADGAVLIQQPRARADWTHLDNEWTVARADGSHSTYRFAHHLYSGEELQSMLKTCGFTDVQLYGDLLGSEYSAQAPRLTAMARKG